jgi:hypothetical protein
MFDSPAKGWLKLSIGIGLATLLRLVPFRPPNVEPLLAIAMPFSRRYGPLWGASFAALAILVHDVAMGQVGTWTLVTAPTYALVGAGASVLARHRETGFSYAAYAVAATLFYDLVTGVVMGPLLFGQDWGEAFIGQIPFTVNHLLGNVVFAFVASPFVSRWLVSVRKLDADRVFPRGYAYR